MQIEITDIQLIFELGELTALDSAIKNIKELREEYKALGMNTCLKTLELQQAEKNIGFHRKAFDLIIKNGGHLEGRMDFAATGDKFYLIQTQEVA